MSYRQLKKEAKADMERYYEELTKIEDHEDREFLINGIIHIDLKYRDEKIFRKMDTNEMRNQIVESIYTLEAIADFCTVELKQLKHFVAGKLPPSKVLKKIYVGLKAYGV